MKATSKLGQFCYFIALLPIICSCSSNVREEIAFLNNKGCVLYTYLEKISKEKYGFNSNVDFVSFNSFDSIPETNKPYEFMYVNCEKFESTLNGEKSTQIYNWLTDYSHKRCAIFYGNDDSFFFKDSPLETLFGLYCGNDSLLIQINNYSFDSLSMIHSGPVNVGGFDAVVSSMYHLVLEYVRRL